MECKHEFEYMLDEPDVNFYGGMICSICGISQETSEFDIDLIIKEIK